MLFSKILVAIVVQLIPLIVLVGNQSANAQRNETSKVLACYFHSTSYSRDGMPFRVSDVDASLCSHILYTYIGMREENCQLYSKNPDIDLGPGEVEPWPDDPSNAVGEHDFLRSTGKLRETNPSLKIMASVGGPDQSSRSFSNMARHIANRTLFIRSVLNFVETFDLDGIDIYWVYPGLNGGRETDIETFVVVLKELRSAFTNLTQFTGKQYLISAALGCKEEIISAGYDAINLTEHVDFLTLMCFDLVYYENSNPILGHHTPLYNSTTEADRNPQNEKSNVAYGVNHLLSIGAKPDKLLLGISTQARTYTLESGDGNFGAITGGPGEPGNYTNTTGALAYFEICEVTNTEGWQFRYHHEYRIPYFHDGIMWIGHDNEVSAQEKVDFAMAKGFLGAAIFTIDMDDYSNLCEAWNPYSISYAVRDRINHWNA